MSAEGDPELADLVMRLADSDEERRDAAVKELRALGEKGVSRRQGLYLLRAAANQYPPQKFAIGSTQLDLIRAVASKPRASYVPIVKQIFPKLVPPSNGALSDPRDEALALLAAIDDKSGALALLDLVEAAAAAGAPLALDLDALAEEPKFPEIYFPRLLKSAKGATAPGVYSLALAYANKGALTPAQLAPHAAVFVDAYRSMESTLAAAQTKPGTSWLWDDSYAYVRRDAGLVLDLMGYVPSADVEAVLDEASKLKDPKLVHFAATSLIRLGRPVAASILDRIAASPEIRGWLFDELTKLNKSELFPRKWLTQKAFAESEMVRWLVFPTELGRAPDDIELMKVVAKDFGPPDGVYEWYLFRFRTRPPHWKAKDGWMAGVAGPFKKADSPTTSAGGDTFSEFTPWGSRTLEQHVAEVRKLTERAPAREEEAADDDDE